MTNDKTNGKKPRNKNKNGTKEYDKKKQKKTKKDGSTEMTDLLCDVPFYVKRNETLISFLTTQEIFFIHHFSSSAFLCVALMCLYVNAYVQIKVIRHTGSRCFPVR